MERVEIKKIVHGGYGLGFGEGKTVLIPYTAPGDVVEYTVRYRKKNTYFGEISKIVESSGMRVEPRCPVFGRCGGCHLQHIGYEDELKIKERIVLESFERIGRIKTNVTRVVPSPERFGYRNHTIFKADPIGNIGFNKRESYEVVPFPKEGCLLLPETMRKAIAEIPRTALSCNQEIRARSDADGRTYIWGLEEIEAPEEITMRAGGFTFNISPGAFFQVNSLMLEEMISLISSIPLQARRHLLDLYSGVGFFSLPLSKLVIDGLGIEKDRAAYINAIEAARANGVGNIRFKNGRVEREIVKLRDFDLIVADPPRTGTPKIVLKNIIRIRPKELVLISCDPPTLARDAGRLLETGYVLSELYILDIFPATYHIETIAVFRRGA
ncbi:hypothetical protein DRQ05_02390 [bacterium]|nr:MAG: hypothetical protein DRQ05_02390 [bacterium]